MEDSADVLVVPNIKRWAMSSDSYMRWHMDAREEKWPTWWDPDNRSVNVWGQEFPIRDIIRETLAQAFQEAGVEGSFEWRVGCPVHSGLDYRLDLTHALSELAGQGDVSWVVEEPLLLLALGHRALKNPAGSYLVYDLGGGSFDSTMAEVGEDGEMVVYGADGASSHWRVRHRQSSRRKSQVPRIQWIPNQHTNSKRSINPKFSRLGADWRIHVGLGGCGKGVIQGRIFAEDCNVGAGCLCFRKTDVESPEHRRSA